MEDGSTKSLPPATRSAAGVMTVDHVEMLEDVYQRVIQAGSDAAGLIPHLPADMSEFVTRAEVREALDRFKNMQVPQPRAVEPIDVTPIKSRVQALEGQISQMRSIQPAAAPNDLSTRIALLEVRQTELETSVLEVAETAGGIENMLQTLYTALGAEDPEQLKIAG